MKRILFLLCMIACVSLSTHAQKHEVFSRADSLRGTLGPLRSCYDVLSYDLRVRLNIPDRFISGSNTMTFKALKDMQDFQIDLFSGMRIDKILCGEKEITFSREHNAVFVRLPYMLQKDEKCSVTVFYSGKPVTAKHPPWDGGFVWEKDGKDSWVGVSCQGIGASLWWPCKDHQSDEPENMWIRVSVPKGYTDVSNGRLIRTIPDGKDYTSFEWYVASPINSYNVSLNVAKYKHFSDTFLYPGMKDTLSLDYYVLSRNYEKAAKHFSQVKPMLTCYYRLFGEYPFVKDGYKLVETPYLGMEHQSAIAYGNDYRSGYMGLDLSGSGAAFDYIIIHETAHEWWGNSITSKDIADMWIHEAFATYAEALYVECLEGYDRYLAYINGIKQNVRNDRPVIGAYGVNSEGSADMYPKGALLIHTIRSIIDDDEKFFPILKGLQEKFRHAAVSTAEIESYISERSGISLEKVFDQYLRSKDIPVLEIEVSALGADLQVDYRWKPDVEKNNIFDMPVKLSFSKEDYEMIFPKNDWQRITLPGMKKEDLKVATHLFYTDVLIREK